MSDFHTQDCMFRLLADILFDRKVFSDFQKGSCQLPAEEHVNTGYDTEEHDFNSSHYMSVILWSVKKSSRF